MSSKKFRSLLSVVLLLSTLLAACGPGGFSGKPTPTPLPAVVSVEKAVFTVEEGPIISEEEIQGEISPAKQDELFFRSSGYITRVVVKPGDFVKKGDILAELQVDDLLNQLQQSQIDLEVSQSSLAKEKITHEYDVARAQAEVFQWEKRVQLAEMDMKYAYGENLTRAQINLDMTKKNLELAQQNLDLITQNIDTYMEQAVKRNELAVARLQKLLEDRQIIAPYDAVILRSGIRPGQNVEAFFSAFVIGDPSELVVRSTYDYDLADKLTDKLEMSVRLNRTDKSEKGYATKYLPNFETASITDQTQVKNSTQAVAQFFYFELPKDLPADQIKVERQVTIVIVLGRKDNALLLPPAAIREYRGLNFVIVQDGDRRRRVEINKIGLKSTEMWEVIADLRPGDKVLGP